MTIRAVVVDDEPLAREGIRLRLQAEPDIEVVAEHGSAREAIAALDSDDPNLIFLDIQMPGMTGLDMLRLIGPDRVPAVVLVTAYQEHALDAFDLDVVDYVLKPIDGARFALAVARARARLELLEAVQFSDRLRSLVGDLERVQSGGFSSERTRATERAGFLTRFLVPSASGEAPLNASEVNWIQAAGDYVRLHCADTYHLLRDSMANLERVLDPRQFARIHRSAIVQLDRVRELKSTDHGDAEVHLTDGTVLRLSRGYREKFRATLSAPRVPPRRRGSEPG